MDQKLINQIEEIYSQIPNINCKRKCQEACGPIMMSPLEQNRINEHLGKSIDFLSSKQCPLLSIFGNCSIYEIRPLICRIYGTVKALECPHDCLPDKWLDDTKAQKLIQHLQTLSTKVK